LVKVRRLVRTRDEGVAVGSKHSCDVSPRCHWRCGSSSSIIAA
jgi:hypothetical protein